MKYFKFSLLITIITLLFSGCSSSSPDPATVAYTFVSNGLSCASAQVNGTYIAGTTLTASNTIALHVNVTVVGDYSISTNVVNGISFSKTGTFTATGDQVITLNGAGTPAAAGIRTYTFTGGGNTCSVDLTAISNVPAGAITCKMNGVLYNFTVSPHGSLVNNPGMNFKVYARSGSTGFEIWIQHPTLTPLTTGSYNVNMPGFYIKGQYTDAVYNYWMGESNGSTQSNPFTIVITSLNATEVTGTFSGLLKENAGSGPATKVVTEGTFHMPL